MNFELDTLFVIPARAGSEGISGKNYKLLGGKPLVQHSLELARAMTTDENICVSTNDAAVVAIMESLGYQVPFVRPQGLATNIAGTYQVLLHALEFYETAGRRFEQLVLLQPTSPFRTVQHLSEAMSLYTRETEMVVSVKITHANPYFVLMEENQEGWLEKSKPSLFARRQDAPEVYELNGAIYVMNTAALKEKPPGAFTRVRKYVMNEICSVDLDSPLDWLVAETILANELFRFS